MIFGEPARHADERIRAQRQVRCHRLGAQDPVERTGIGGHRSAQRFEDRLFGRIDARTEARVARCHRHVVARVGPALPERREPSRHVGLERRLVVRETDVAREAKEALARVDVGEALVEAHGRDQQCGHEIFPLRPDVFVVDAAMRRKPRPVVVLLQLTQPP